MRYILSFFLTMALAVASLHSEEYTYRRGIPYRTISGTGDEYTAAMCQLDVAYLAGGSNAPVVVWFHGGGLTGGKREIPSALLVHHFVVVGVEYRLSPKATIPEILDDAAAAVAWVFEHAPEYGGNPESVYIAGHSAGGYLVNMVGLNQALLEKYGCNANKLAGIIPYSGHAITHFTTRNLKGMPPHQALIDETAPLYYVRKDAAPILILSGDREKELYGRYEETAFFWRMFQLAGHPDVTLYELDGYDHGNMPVAGHPLAIKFILGHEKAKKKVVHSEVME